MAELTREIMSPQNMELLIGNLQCLEEYDTSNNTLQSSYNFHMINGSNFYDPLLPADHHHLPSFPNSIGTEAIPLPKSNTSKYHSNKRKRGCETRGEEKPKEVVHVRAKRGQATDSHSLAERHRRERINEKLRSLQDLVPGCYKAMGMAVMLDVIINYVRSLQNQIEFLSMKLAAASMFIDFNSPEMDTLGSMQGTNDTTGGEWSSYGGVPPNNLIYPWPL